MSRTPEYLVADLELWADRIADGHIFHIPDELNCAAVMRLAAMMLKSPQRTWVGLTDEEIKAFDTWHDNREEEIGWVNPSEIVAYIEAKLKEKNT
jgi:hypothetical protein